MDGIQIRPAEPRDAPQIAELFSNGFRPQIAQLLIYGCSGAAEYISMQLAGGAATSESAYFVAEAAGEIIGAAELRRSPNRLLLNYIGVRPDYRGKRVGATLFSGALRLSGVRSGQIGLDVFEDNVRALHWYSGLGFETRVSTEFIEVLPAAGAFEQDAYISGLPQADLCQERFGFSKFDLITGDGTFTIGRISDSWFRLTDIKAVTSPSVFAALRTLESRRRIFAVLPASSLPPARVARLLARTHRMEAEIPVLATLLANDYKKSRRLA